MFEKLKKKFRMITEGRQTHKNPNRVKRAKINLRPDQKKRLNAMGPAKHKIMRKLVDTLFNELDNVKAATR